MQRKGGERDGNEEKREKGIEETGRSTQVMYASTSCTTPSHPPHTGAIRARTRRSTGARHTGAQETPPHATYANVSLDPSTRSMYSFSRSVSIACGMRQLASSFD
jgi:hypothetical protein